MYDSLTASTPQRTVPFDASPPASPLLSPTSETLPVSASALSRALDVIDYGVLLVLADNHVVHANQVARREMNELHPLHLSSQQLRVRRPQDMVALRSAIASACDKGLQRMLTIGDETTERTVVSIMPMPRLGANSETGAMLMFAKRRDCTDLATEAFARSNGLTAAEIRVLKQLCAGRRPAEIAQSQGVALCTVRTQIGTLREKTGSSCIRDLIQEVSRLPPLPLRTAA